MTDALVEASTQASLDKLRESIKASAEAHLVVGADFRESVQSITTNFMESLKSRKSIAGGGCTTHTIVKVDIEMPPQRGVRNYHKVYRAVCTVDPEAAPHIVMLKGVTKRKAKRWLRQSKALVGSLVSYLTFVPVMPIEYITLKIHVEDTRNDGRPRNGQEHDSPPSA